MKVFEKITSLEHEQVTFFYDPETGAQVIIGIHDTTLGPALGGARLWHYQKEEDALFDVLRLSRGMTYKAAVAGLKLGGGKSVLLKNDSVKTDEAFFRSFGKFVESLNGKYITAEDVGTNVQYMQWVRKETKHVVGLPIEDGGSGDPSIVTAWGVFHGIRASCKKVFGNDDLSGKKVAIQGCGHVACFLVDFLLDAGVEITVCDIDQEKLKNVAGKKNVKIVNPEEIYSQDVDIFSPCALGAILNDKTIPLLKAKIVAGAANNQLYDEKADMQRLMEKNILYAPDYVINAGGLINVYHEYTGNYNREAAFNQTREIYNTLLKIYETADSQKISTNEAAQHLAEERIAEGKS